MTLKSKLCISRRDTWSYNKSDCEYLHMTFLMLDSVQSIISHFSRKSIQSDEIYICIYIYTGWNDKIVALEKTTWFHFWLMKTGFLFFVADHLLVGQLCTDPKTYRSLLSCLKVTQCSTSEIGDALLYNSCTLPIQVMTTAP